MTAATTHWALSWDRTRYVIAEEDGTLPREHAVPAKDLALGLTEWFYRHHSRSTTPSAR
jgi:hypothetical protein